MKMMSNCVLCSWYMGVEIREQISHFTFEFPAEEVRQIWKCCRDVATASEFMEEEMEAFHRLDKASNFSLCLLFLGALASTFPSPWA